MRGTPGESINDKRQVDPAEDDIVARDELHDALNAACSAVIERVDQLDPDNHVGYYIEVTVVPSLR